MGIGMTDAEVNTGEVTEAELNARALEELRGALAAYPRADFFPAADLGPLGLVNRVRQEIEEWAALRTQLRKSLRGYVDRRKELNGMTLLHVLTMLEKDGDACGEKWSPMPFDFPGWQAAQAEKDRALTGLRARVVELETQETPDLVTNAEAQVWISRLMAAEKAAAEVEVWKKAFKIVAGAD